MVFDWNKVREAHRQEITREQIDWEQVEQLTMWYQCREGIRATQQKYDYFLMELNAKYQYAVSVRWADKFGRKRWSPPMSSIARAKSAIRMIKQEEKQKLS